MRDWIRAAFVSLCAISYVAFVVTIYVVIFHFVVKYW